MPSWKSRYAASIVFLSAVCTILATIIVPDEAKKLLWESILQRSWSVPVWLVVVVFLVLLFCICGVADEMAKERHKRRNLEQIKEAALQQLRTSEQMRQIDVVTRIPNQSKLEADLQSLTNRMKPDDEYQVIMLDLERFGRINQRFGYQIGDDVIEYIAQSIYQSMRRDEEAYKRPLAGDITPDSLWRRMYRKYTGGDEFIFVVSGNEPAALGFLLRQKRRFDGEFQTHIEKNILHDAWDLRFHAGVCPFYWKDTFDTVMPRVEDCLRKAKQMGSKTRVFWFSRSTPSNFSEGDRNMQTYLDAEKAFASPL